MHETSLFVGMIVYIFIINFIMIPADPADNLYILKALSYHNKGDKKAIKEALGIPQLSKEDEERFFYWIDQEHINTYFVSAYQEEKLVTLNRQKAKEGLLMSSSDGVTKFEAYWWGCEVYISHKDLKTYTSVSSMLSLLGAIPGLAVLGAIFAAEAILYNWVDNGRGIILKKFAYIGHSIPSAQ